MLAEVVLLGLYWVIAASSLIWVPYLLGPLDCFALTTSVITFMVAVGSMTASSCFLSKSGKKSLATLGVFSPMFIAFAAGALLIWLTRSLSLRPVISAFGIGVFIGVFNFVLHSEEVESEDELHVRLMHKGYLEYARNFFWATLIALLAYLAWELQAFGPLTEIHAVLGVLQVMSVFVAGSGIVFWAFHTKLRQIEGRK